MNHRLLAFASIVVLSGCASLPKPSELTAGAKTASFVQHGAEPNKYLIGAVDGKTSWTQGSPSFSPGSSSSVDVGAAAAANIFMFVGQKIAEEALKDDPEYYIRTLMKMVNGRKMTNEIAPSVFPELAGAWGFTYDQSKLLQIPNGTPLVNEQGIFNGKDPGTDLVLAYGIEQLTLSERPTMSVIFKSVGTAGMYDRPVVPFILGSMTAFKRNDKGELKQIWASKCNDIYYMNAPVSEEWILLKEHPEKAVPVFDAAIPIAIDSCKKTLKQANGT